MLYILYCVWLLITPPQKCYTVVEISTSEKDVICAKTPKKAIKKFMHKWWPVLPHDGPWYLQINNKEYEIFVEQTFTVREGKYKNANL